MFFQISFSFFYLKGDTTAVELMPFVLFYFLFLLGEKARVKDWEEWVMKSVWNLTSNMPDCKFSKIYGFAVNYTTKTEGKYSPSFVNLKAMIRR